MLKVEATEDKATDSWDLKFIPVRRSDWDTFKAITNLIKATIPVSDRTYDPETKHWGLLSKHYVIFKTNCKLFGIDWKEVTPIKEGNFFYEEALNSPVVVTKESLAAQLCKLLEVTSEILKDTNAAKKAYRAAALKYHPDRNNGDGARMSELNSIWSQYNATI